MTPDIEDDEIIRDPSKQGWLKDICSLDVELLVTPAGTRKLPGRPREYANGDESMWFLRADYTNWTESLIGYRIDPAQAWYIDMGHGDGSIPSDA